MAGVFSRLVAGRRERPAVADLPDVTLRPIGIVRSKVRGLRRCGTVAGPATIEIAPEHAAALAGLDGFSHLLVLTWLDRVSDDERRQATEHPGGDRSLPAIGVLALRTHHRPNPISITVVALESVDGPLLRVRGLDTIDGTPVLDVKPYIPHYDSVPAARLPGWATGDG
jgi:tRNA-Thr(GGU) m(6)t(6)A37 methyltransferase TsaA